LAVAERGLRVDPRAGRESAWAAARSGWARRRRVVLARSSWADRRRARPWGDSGRRPELGGLRQIAVDRTVWRDVLSAMRELATGGSHGAHRLPESRL